MKPQNPTRIAAIDLLKAIAMQVIVLHHFVSYGPLAEAAQETYPVIAGWLYEHGRVAVQVFLVIGGYLAARALSPRADALQDNLGRIVTKRYLRLVPPYAVALLAAIVCAELARVHINDDVFISATPTFAQVAAHLLLLHQVFGYESLSAGVWYVAIDFQLFVLLALLLWVARKMNVVHGIPALVTLAGAVSMLHINGSSHWDAYGPYFFGAYALGALAWWATAGVVRMRAWGLCLVGVALIALMCDFRWRLFLALITAVFLYASVYIAWPASRTVSFLARTSYALFLMHFPVFMLVSALAVRMNHAEGWCAGAALIVAWGGSIAAAYMLHRYIESPRQALPFFRLGARRA